MRSYYSLTICKALFVITSLTVLSILYAISRITFWESTPINIKNAIKVSVYYESLCPYSIRFITQQLYPNYDRFAADLDVELVPYGKANHTIVNNAWEFECQHGSDECRGNKYQACVLNQNYTQAINVEIINCIMNQSDPSTESSANKCVTNANIDFNIISQCFNNEGGEVLALLGNKTKAAIDLYQTGVPTIIFENKYSSSLHTLATSNFTLALCTADADICASKNGGVRTAVFDYVLLSAVLLLLLLKQI